MVLLFDSSTRRVLRPPTGILICYRYGARQSNLSAHLLFFEIVGLSHDAIYFSESPSFSGNHEGLSQLIDWSFFDCDGPDCGFFGMDTRLRSFILSNKDSLLSSS